MKNYLVAVLMACVSLTACADPVYVNNSRENPDSKPQQCEVFFEKSEVCAFITWAEGPTKGKESKFDLQLMNAGNNDFAEKVKTADLNVILWMPSMGHGSSPTEVFKLPGMGFFAVSKVHFIMGGEWEIRFELKNGSEVLDEAIYKLEL